jgi:uncharacterized protein (TIGR03083 family)
MDPAQIYATCRRRLLDLAPGLSDEQRAAPLAPTPPWTVTDGYRHLTGVCCDVLEGNMPQGDPTQATEWTAAQLAARAGWPLEQVCQQWAERGPALDEMIEAAGPRMGFAALDAWVHEQDVRAGAGVGALHDDDLLPGLVDLTVGAAGRFYAPKGPALRLVVDGEEHTIGEGDPAATLTTSAYDLMRIVFGRRSPAQIEAADWSGPDAARAQQAITLFPPQPRDLVD